jgi:hypothetical protein
LIRRLSWSKVLVSRIVRSLASLPMAEPGSLHPGNLAKKGDSPSVEWFKIV